MAKPKKKQTAAQRKAKRDRKMLYQTIYINGKQKRVRRERMIEGLSVDEFIANNSNAIDLHEIEMRELM